MNNGRFVFISFLIFLGQFFLSVFWPFLLRADIFIAWTAAVFFLDIRHKLSFFTFILPALFFEIWSGRSFGILTVGLLLTMLIIFLIRKMMLIERGNVVMMIFWTFVFYQLCVFVIVGVSWLMGEAAVWPIFDLWNLAVTILWLIIFVKVFKFYDQSRVRSPGIIE